MKVLPSSRQFKEKKLESDKLLQQNLFSGKQFTDDEFPATKYSLIANPKNLTTSNIFESLNWKRPSEVYRGANLRLFPDYLYPNSIQPGVLSYPYFLSALSILAEKPKVLARVFAKFQVNDAGLYSVYLNNMGEWQLIVIDDYFPFSSYSNKWAFTHGEGSELWPLILEKAYAKAHKSYESLEKGFVAETLMDMIGAPFDILKLSDDDELYFRLKGSLNNKYFIYCSRLRYQNENILKGAYSPLSGRFNPNISNDNISGFNYESIDATQSKFVGSGTLENFRISTRLSPIGANFRSSSPGHDSVLFGDKTSKYSPKERKSPISYYKEDSNRTTVLDYEDPSLLGLSKGYEYSILDIREINLQKKGKPERLIKIRNPWMATKWNGRWSQYSKEWTPNLIQELRYDPRNPGDIFWITWEDFVKFYDIVCISKYEEDFQYTTIALEQVQGSNDRKKIYSSIVKIKVQKPTKAFISVNQADEKNFKKNSSMVYQYSGCRLVLGKLADKVNGLEFVTAKYNNSRNTSLEADLEVGEYIVSVDMLWETTNIRNFTLSCYSLEAVMLEEIDNRFVYQIQKNLIKSLSLQNPSFLDQTSRNYETLKDKGVFMTYGGKNFGILFFYYRNFSRKQILIQETVEIQTSGLELFEEEEIGNNYMGKLVFISSKRFIIEIGPGDEAVILFKANQFRKPNYNVKFDFVGEPINPVPSPLFRPFTIYDGSENMPKAQKLNNIDLGKEPNNRISIGSPIRDDFGNFSSIRDGEVFSQTKSFSASQIKNSQAGDGPIRGSRETTDKEEKRRIAKFIKSSKQPTKRVWDGKFADCYAYNYQAKQGYFILIENLTDMIYEEMIDITDFENLDIRGNNVQDGKVVFAVEPGQFDYVFFQVMDPRKNYCYTHKNMYKFVNVR